MHQAGEQGSFEYVPALDGLRGLAVLAVLGFHAGLPQLRGGFLGVSAFFTLSGFLITSLLLVEHERTGRIDLRAFWVRRARRLLPAALLTLAATVVFGLAVADPSQVRALPGDVLAALAYVANWRFVVAGTSYAELFTAPSPVQHLWSLAIEEQFYVAFPVLAAGALALGRRPRLALGVMIVALVGGSIVSLVTLAEPGGDTTRTYYGTDTRAAELLIGCLLAVWLRSRAGDRPRVGSWAAAVGSGALVALGALWWRTGQADDWLYTGGFAVHAALTAALIAAAHRPGPATWLLARRPLRHMGRISYGTYLLHWPIFLWLSPERTGVGGVALLGLRAATTLVAAELSFRLLEDPVRRRRILTGRRGLLALPTAVTGVAVAALAVAATAPPPPPPIVYAAISDAPPPTLPTAPPRSPPRDGAAEGDPARAIFGTSTFPGDGDGPSIGAPAPPAGPSSTTITTGSPVPARPPRVLLVGDSVAQTFGRGLERWGASTGAAQVWNQGTYFCGVFRGGEIDIGPIISPSAACEGWAERWTGHLDAFDPDIVVVLSTVWDIVPRRLPEWDDFRGIDDPEYAARVRADYLAAIDLLSSRGAEVVWLTPPCHGGDEYSDAQLDTLRTGFAVPAVRARRDVARIVDLAELLCPGGVFQETLGDVAMARPDGLHFSDPGADWAAARIGPLVVDGWVDPDATR